MILATYICLFCVRLQAFALLAQFMCCLQFCLSGILVWRLYLKVLTLHNILFPNLNGFIEYFLCRMFFFFVLCQFYVGIVSIFLFCLLFKPKKSLFLKLPHIVFFKIGNRVQQSTIYIMLIWKRKYYSLLVVVHSSYGVLTRNILVLQTV